MLGVPRGVGGIHVALVPLVDAGGDGVETPVDEDAEFGLVEPRGSAIVVAEGLPRRLEGTRRERFGLGVGVGRAGRSASLSAEASREARCQQSPASQF